MNTNAHIGKFAILVSYDGTPYCGWQDQPKAHGPSVQSTLEAALFRMTGERVKVTASGRTDAGVHAAAQVAHFRLTQKPWPLFVIERGLNSLLPESIRVLRAFGVDEAFHSQRVALQKQYSYYLMQGPCPLPSWSRYSWWIRKELDLECMKEGLRTLRGEHDFVAFRAAGGTPGSAVRTLYETELSIEAPLHFPGTGYSDFRLIRLRFLGSGFLKHMIRGIVGTLVPMGEGKLPASRIQQILDEKDRKLLGPAAPGHGLWMERVWYPDPWSGIEP